VEGDEAAVLLRDGLGDLRDDYVAAVGELVSAKASGAVVVGDHVVGEAEVSDLLERLTASVAAKKSAKKAATKKAVKKVAA
jgi:non-homologous end joining protein Ku